MRYLLISFFRKKGGQIDEMVSVSKQVKTSDLQNSNIIMDFGTKKLDKCVIEGKEHDTTFDKLRDYYAKVYPQLVSQLEKEAPFSVSKNNLKGKK
jgi:hypothetical protein